MNAVQMPKPITTNSTPSSEVMLCGQLKTAGFQQLLNRYQLRLIILDPPKAIPGSFWGAPEAGLIGQNIYIRPDTPVHSLLHESCHVICMDDVRRQNLHTDAGGRTPDEENAVCYLQILLADGIKGFGHERALLDMDRWGYSFRLGSAKRWFTEDAEDARKWLLDKQLIDQHNRPTYRLA